MTQTTPAGKATPNSEAAKDKGLRLGIDIDGTITDPATFIPFLNKAFNKNLLFSEITQYDLSPLYGISVEQFFSWLHENEGEIYAQASLAEHAIDVLSKLYKQHKLYYISARSERHFQLTQHWFSQFNVPYHHIELIGSHDKINVAKKHEIDLFFEDKLDNANDLAEELQIPVILFNTPYNQGSTHPAVKRTEHWREAEQLIFELSRDKSSR